MLPSVLLHMIKSPGPIHATCDCTEWDLAIDHVHDIFAIVAHIDDIRIAELPQIMRLPTGSRIKRRAIQHDIPSRRRTVRFQLAAQHLRAKFALIRIVVIKPACRHNFQC